MKFITIPKTIEVLVADPVSGITSDAKCTWAQFIAMVFNDQKLLEKRSVFELADLRKKLIEGTPGQVIEVHSSDYPALLAAIEKPSTVNIGFAYQIIDWFKAIRDATDSDPRADDAKRAATAS